MPFSLVIFYDPTIDYGVVEKVKLELKSTFNIQVNATISKILNEDSYDKKRNQYDGQQLLNSLIDNENLTYFLWLVSKDLYVPGRNFVFGLASQYYGAIVSFYRLKSANMKIKESIHECGHILGLGHCKRRCVMQYSTNLEEANSKPQSLCSKCKKILLENEKKIDENKD
jgi:archaemetzincin